MNLFRVCDDDDVLEVGRGRLGRMTHAATRFVLWFPVGLVAVSAVFLPDYLGHYRAEESVGGIFWWVMAAVAAFVAFIGAFVRFSRRDTWLFDVAGERVVFRARPMIGRSATATIELDRLERVRFQAQGAPKESSIRLEFRGHRDELLAETHLGADRLREVYRAIETFVDRYGLEVACDEESA